MEPFSILRPVSFIVKKWILVLSVLVNVAYLSLLLLYCTRFVDGWLLSGRYCERYRILNGESGDSTEKEYTRQVTTTTLLSITAMLLLFELLLLLGLLTESLCLSTTYALSTVATTLLVTVAAALYAAVLLVFSLWSAFIALLALFYLHELKTVRMLAAKRVTSSSSGSGSVVL
ncbi:hypothetical protein TYRP_010307 [Tyrophagus putrescentiae]|nr:hypothetical protein TYRP_010307 [Tyrophagus putrescentiae]